MPAAKTTFTASLPDGTSATTNTSRALTHVAAVFSNGIWGVSWHTSEVLAAKMVSRLQHHGATQARVIAL